MDTGTVPTSIAVPVDVPAGFWRRESTHCPQPISPFLRGAAGIVTECWRRAFSELGVLADALELREIGGWVYSSLVPLGGWDGQAPDPDLIRRRGKRAVEVIRSGRLISSVDEWPQRRSEFIAGLARLRSVDLSKLSDKGLAEHLGEVMQFSLRAFDLHFLLHGIGAIVLADLAFTGRELLGWDDAKTLGLLSGLSGASTEPADALARLTEMARERSELRRLLESPEEHASRLWDVAPDFAGAFAAYQDEFGFRSIRYDVLDPSQGETPSFTLRLIADQVRSGYDPAARDADTTRRREALRSEARTALAGRSEADRARFEQTLERAERWYPVREDEAPMTFGEPLSLMRRLALEMGRRLAESSLIDAADDVFFLELEEASAALAGRATGAATDWENLVRRRRAERVWAEAHPGPASFGAAPTLIPDRGDLPPEARFPTEAVLWLVERSGHFATTLPQPGGRHLTGIPASGGSYTGPVRVLSCEADFDKLQPGDVLVCPITSPAWSVLFPSVGALVTDAGGLMSHSAIIAREFHIPAVVATGNASSLLRDGQLVTVDGAAGSVVVQA